MTDAAIPYCACCGDDCGECNGRFIGYVPVYIPDGEDET